MKRAIQLFQSDDFAIRSLLIDGEPWFIAADVCRALNLADVSVPCSRLDADDRKLATVETPGGSQTVLVVSEPGYYDLVLSGRTPEAKARRRELLSLLTGRGLHEQAIQILTAETSITAVQAACTDRRETKAGRKQARRHRSEVFMRDGRRCVYCGSHENLQLDHIVPVVHDGGHGIDNLQTLCRSCNLSKGAKL